MAASAISPKKSTPITVTTDTIVKSLDSLPSEYLPDVLDFVQFLQYKSQPSFIKETEQEIQSVASHLSESLEENLELAYQQMAQDERRELEALEWAEATIGDVSNETR